MPLHWAVAEVRQQWCLPRCRFNQRWLAWTLWRWGDSNIRNLATSSPSSFWGIWHDPVFWQLHLGSHGVQSREGHTQRIHTPHLHVAWNSGQTNHPTDPVAVYNHLAIECFQFFRNGRVKHCGGQTWLHTLWRKVRTATLNDLVSLYHCLVEQWGRLPHIQPMEKDVTPFRAVALCCRCQGFRPAARLCSTTQGHLVRTDCWECIYWGAPVHCGNRVFCTAM